MKHLFFLSLLFLVLSPSFLYSQEFDEAFLKSLPEDVAADLMEKADKKETACLTLCFKNFDKDQYSSRNNRLIALKTPFTPSKIVYKPSPIKSNKYKTI